MADQRAPEDAPDHHHIANVGISIVENVIYVGIAVLLALASASVLVLAAIELFEVFDAGDETPIIEALDLLLLLFILVELLSATRVTIAKRELVAEPFLLVGIIASIKEIVVLSVKAAEDIGQGAGFRDQLWEISVLGVVVVLLGGTAWLLRVKEREPGEGGEQVPSTTTTKS